MHDVLQISVRFMRACYTNNEEMQHTVWLTYDAEADTLYVNFKKPSYASDSEMTEDDVIVRYEGDEVIGFTVLHAAKRIKKTA